MRTMYYYTPLVVAGVSAHLLMWQNVSVLLGSSDSAGSCSPTLE